MEGRYTFTNWTDQPFDGRMGGVPQHFEPGETKEYDPDKHGMLVVMAKHLADQELLKNIKSVGRNPNNEETWAKSLDAEGKPFVITSDMRKEYMRKAVGALVDTPVPIPEDETPEGGATERMSTDVSALQDQIKHLTEMVGTLSAKIGAQGSEPEETPPQETPPTEVPPVEEPPEENVGSIAREALVELAAEQGIAVTPSMTKQEILNLLNNQKPVAVV